MFVNRLQSVSVSLATVGLSPLLLTQGLWVRKRTPLLPEPAGERDGQLGSGAPLRLLILGDSAAAGVGVTAQADALSGQLTQRLANDHAVSWRLLAKTGHRARDSLRQLYDLPDLQCDVALTSLGVNDATALASPERFGTVMRQVVQHLRVRCGARLILLSGLPPLHRFPALPEPLRWRLGHQARLLDGQLSQLAAIESDCEHLPFEPLPDDSYMASDGFHPGIKAFSAWADAATARIVAWRSRSESLSVD
jgi:lysophospholipase L1-like esterase